VFLPERAWKDEPNQHGFRVFAVTYLQPLGYQRREIVFDVVNEIICERVHTTLGVPYLIIEKSVAEAEWLDGLRGDPEFTNDPLWIGKRH